MNAVLEQQPLEDLKTYLTWDLVRDNSLFLPASFQQASFDFYEKTLKGAKEMRARWKRCVDLTDEQLPDALGKTFVEKTLGDAGKKRTQQMVAEIEKALEKDIRGLDWMTPKTKDQAIVKLHGITNKIGNKSKWLDYAGVQIVRNDPYANTARTSTFELARQLGQDREAGGQDRVGHEPAHGERVLRSAAQRHQLSRRHSAAAVLRQQNGRCGELRRHRRGDRP